MSYRKKRCFLLILSWVLSACDALSDGTETSKSIASQFEAHGKKAINLAEAVPGSWERVCILGPYAGNDEAKKTLGFEWDVESKTSIRSNEGISLLLFVKGNEVVEYVEHRRSWGDFSNLTMKCFLREKSKFVQRQDPKKGWPGLFPEN